MVTSIYRTIVLYVVVVVLLRFMGKRQIGELQPSELVATVFISNLASISVENLGEPFLNSLIPIIVLGCLEMAISALSLKSLHFRKLVSGSPIIVIREGEIDQKALQTIRFSADELYEQMRTSGYFSLDEIAFGIVETNGNVSFYPSFQGRGVTCGDLDLKAPQIDAPPVVVVNDGQIDAKALAFVDSSGKGVQHILRKEAIPLKEVFLLYMDSQGKYTIIPKGGSKRGGTIS